jgi:predicted O-methyltransferase YrrM
LSKSIKNCYTIISSLRIAGNNICEHKYTMPCYYKLKEMFGNRLNIIVGDTRQTLKQITGPFDLIHIDGGKSIEFVENDIVQSLGLSKHGTIIIMNDYNFPELHKLWSKYIDEYKLQKLNVCEYVTHQHDIKYVVKQ